MNREALIQARRILASMSEHERTKHFDMYRWGYQTKGGSVACVAGHCGMDPWFIERGFSLSIPIGDGLEGTILYSLHQNGWRLTGWESIEHFFGLTERQVLQIFKYPDTVEEAIAAIDQMLNYPNDVSSDGSVPT